MSQTQAEVVLFDLQPRGEARCYSPHVWKVRASLNFKGTPYKTEWTDYPELHQKLISFGIPQNDPEEHFRWSCPTVRLPDGSYIMESRKIVAALEKLQPEPSLHLDTEYPKRAQDIVDKMLYSISVPLVYRIPEMLLRPESAKWYHADREKLLGMPLHDLAKLEAFAGDAAWIKAEPAIQELKELLAENPAGPYVLGKEASYADFVIAGYFKILSKIEQDGDTLHRMLGLDPSFEKHWEACQKYFERDDH